MTTIDRQSPRAPERLARDLGDRAPRPPGLLSHARRRPADRPDPRDHRPLLAVGAGDRRARGRPHAAGAGPARTRRVGQAARRLLARRLRERRPRHDGRPRPRPRDDRRALARRRDRDAVRLPISRALRAAGPGLQRRPRPRGPPAAARRDPARLRVGAAAAHPRRACSPPARPSGGRSARCACRPAPTSPRSPAASARSAIPRRARRSSRRCARCSTRAASASARSTASTSRSPCPPC